MVFYIDIYFAVNFTIDFFLLCLTARIMKYKIKPIRILIASVIGALLCIIPLLFNIGYFEIIFSVLLPPVMLFAAFGKKTLQQMLESFTLLFGGAFAAGGVFRAVSEISDNVPKIFLILIFFAVFAFCFIFFDVFSLKRDMEKICVKIKSDGKETEVVLLCDSGCRIREPISGLPVILISKKSFEHVFDPKKIGEESFAITRKQRLVPIKTASGSSVIKAFYADEISFTYKNKKRLCEALVGQSENDSFAGTDGIFPTMLLR